jgi:hypothetical protein
VRVTHGEEAKGWECVLKRLCSSLESRRLESPCIPRRMTSSQSDEVSKAWHAVANFVIVRILSCAVPEPNRDAYLEFVKRNELAFYESSPGLVAVWLLERSFVAYVEVLILSVWDSEKSMMGFVEKHSSLDEVKRGHGVIPMAAHSYRLSASLSGKLRNDIEPSES